MHRRWVYLLAINYKRYFVEREFHKINDKRLKMGWKLLSLFLYSN